LVGKRESSVAVEFDTPDQLEEFEDRTTLPNYPIAPLPALLPQHPVAARTAPEAQDTKKRKRWTQDEEKLIEDGVTEFGPGRWADIKAKYFSGSHRTQIDIKDKYRNMAKTPFDCLR
jgi:hypothetical protein